MIELRNITLLKGSNVLFQDFSFTIHPGEHWVVQGDNGSGKTLLLQLLAGGIHPQKGEVKHSFISGIDWDSRYQQREETIQFIPTHWLQTFLGGFHELFYQQRYYNIDDTHLPTVRDVLGEAWTQSGHLITSPSFNIDPLLDLQITRLSNGQLKKVIILRQLARNIPRLLLLDYPFDGLDAVSRNDLIAFIDEISVKFGIQIVLADHGHNLPEVINRRLVLDRYEIINAESFRKGETSTPPLSTSSYVPFFSNSSSIVEMQDLTIEYSGKKILSNLNWVVRKGERWALTGKNGSGKTTLFSLIFADHPMAYSQKVFLFGKRRGSGESIWDIKKRINYFGPEQTHFLNPRSMTLTGREHINMQAHKKPERLHELVSFFNAAGYIDIPINTLSSGQLQMVLLMNMFIDEKELLLLDEPFQFLDPHNHQRVTDYLNDYLAPGITLILITHDEKDVAKWTQLRKVLS